MSVYHVRMRSVNIGELKNQLSGYLQYVRDGEEIVVRDRRVPIARILPFRGSLPAEKEAALVASGAMKMPEQEMDWDAFFGDDGARGTVSRDTSVKAAIEGRGDR